MSVNLLILRMVRFGIKKNFFPLKSHDQVSFLVRVRISDTNETNNQERQLHSIVVSVYLTNRPHFSIVYTLLLKTSNGILQFLKFDWLTGNGI